jgi:N-glycosylase/DNA lyase
MQPESHEIERFYRRLKETQHRYGMARFEMAILLEEIRTKELWRGKAETFAAFLEEERINESAAYQYMRVARKFFHEIQLNDTEFEKLACINMRILDLAAKIITQENRNEVLDIVMALGERDARLSLEEMKEAEEGEGAANTAVSGFVRRYRQLPNELRMEALQQIMGNGKYAPRPAADA